MATTTGPIGEQRQPSLNVALATPWTSLPGYGTGLGMTWGLKGSGLLQVYYGFIIGLEF